MAVSLSPFAGAGWQFFDNNGVILSGGKLYVYAAGTTSSATTYTSSTGSTANTNPIILNSSGRLANEIWLTTGLNYKFILKTSADVLIGTWDNIPAGTTDVADLQAALASSTGAGMIGYIANDTGTAVATTVQAKLRETVSVKDFGAVGDGVVDDTAAIQSAIDSVVNSGKTGNVYLPSGAYKITSGLTLDTYFVSMEGYCLIDASSITTGAALTIISSVGTEPANGYSRKSHIKGNIRLKGPGKTSVGSIGIDFNSPTASSNASALIENMAVFSFETGHRHANRSYNLVAVRNEISDCAYCVSMPSGFTDYGERITYVGCALYNSDLAVYNNNANGTFAFEACSFDYNTLQIQVNYGRVFLTDCHIEATNYTSEPIIVGPFDGATFVMNGGWLLCTGSNTSSIVSVTTTANEGGGATFKNVSMNNLGTATYFGTGTGRLTVSNVFSYNTTDNPKMLSAASNMLMDGGFEGATVLDAFITSDTAAITSRTTGANIALTNSTAQFHTGSKSLAAAKTFGAGSASTFAITAALKDKNSFGCFRVWYKKAGSQTGTMYVSFAYANIQSQQNNGIPSIYKSSVFATSTVTFTSSATSWVELVAGEPRVSAPSWATHALILVNLDSVGAGTVYFDDAEINEI